MLELTEEELRKALTAAMDEIYELRTALAYEAQVRVADLGYKRYPAGRRILGEQAIERMRMASRGDWRLYVRMEWWVREAARREAGMPQAFNVPLWLDEMRSRRAS